jgi:hypothetical protein
MPGAGSVDAKEGEHEDQHARDGEEQHRRDQLAVADLDEQIFPGDQPGGAEHRHQAVASSR